MKLGKEAWNKISAANPGVPSRVQSLVSVRYKGMRLRGYIVGTETVASRIKYAIDVCAADKAMLKRANYQFSVIIVDHDDLIVK